MTMAQSFAVSLAGALAIPMVLGSCLAPQQPHLAGGGMTWSLHETREEGVKLTFGALASDSVVLMLTCVRNSDQVLMSAEAHSPSAQMVLASGRMRTRLPAVSFPGPGDVQIVEAQGSTRDRALASFADTGQLSLVQSDRTLPLTASGPARTSVSRFFAACRA
jgi:hypothetical protein